MDSPLIEFKTVTKRFGNRTVLDRVNLKIYEGQITTLIGKSGSGKSVLLKHIIGLLSPDEGTILFRGKPMGELKKREWNTCLSQISYMFQNNALFDSMTVYENIALPLRQTTNLSKKEIDRRVRDRIEQTELVEVALNDPAELSGGMQKRVALSRALVTDPGIVLFDEPTSGQDPIRKNAILSMITQYQKKFGFTALIISHDIPDILFISNLILILYEGRIIFQGSPEKLEGFEHPFVDEFIQSLEGFQEALTGLNSKQHFKLRYQMALSHKRSQESYAVACFSLKSLDEICEKLGHETGQEIIKSVGIYIDKHFGAAGGFSARLGIDHFVTVLPYADLEAAERVLDDFAKDLQKQKLCKIQTGTESPSKSCFEFHIFAGLTEGNTGEEIVDIIESARSRQKPIARFSCESKR